MTEWYQLEHNINGESVEQKNWKEIPKLKRIIIKNKGNKLKIKLCSYVSNIAYYLFQ